MNNQVKLIDADKVLQWAAEMKFEGRIIDYWGFSHEISAGTFDPDTPPVPTIKPGDTRDPEKILDGVLGEIDKLKLYDSNPKTFKRINDIIMGR